MLNTELKEQIRASFNNIKDNMPNFKVRSAQNKMIAEVCKTLSGEYDNKNPILCVEAPTGTGKTIAYLIGAIHIAKDRQKKLIISSANVALQEQLLYKDLPELQKYCQIDFDYVLVKGRSRYLCIRNLINLVENNTQESLFDNALLWDEPPSKNSLLQLDEILQSYNDKKWNGEIDDLVQVPEFKVWQKISCNRFTCTARDCEFYQDCSFFKARKSINKADVIVANHDLVLTDLNNSSSILPNIEDSILVFDEAHHLNAKALTHFSLTTSIEHIKTTVSQVSMISGQICKITAQDEAQNKSKQIDDYLSDLIIVLKSLDFNEDIHLFKQGFIDDSIKDICANLLITINIINNKFSELKESWADYNKINIVEKSTLNAINNAIGECEQHLLSVISLFDSMIRANNFTKEPYCRWVSKSVLANKKTNYHLHSAQIDISDNLDKLIWSKAAGVILTSATLSSLGSFARLNQQLGLISDNNVYLRLSSPFNHSKVDFIVAKFNSNPTQVYEHTEEVAQQLLTRIDPQEGSLVLFASNKQMHAVADLVDEKINCNLLVQGEYSKKVILEKHLSLRKNNKGSIIFGLDSFAEGVDLKGDNLTHLVIVKLRFSVPTSPIEKTLADYVESKNRNPFAEISLPDVSLRLIQACGRLIRDENDTGKITIFDNRLVHKFYGKKLLNSLPGYNIVIE